MQRESDLVWLVWCRVTAVRNTIIIIIIMCQWWWWWWWWWWRRAADARSDSADTADICHHIHTYIYSSIQTTCCRCSQWQRWHCRHLSPHTHIRLLINTDRGRSQWQRWHCRHLSPHTHIHLLVNTDHVLLTLAVTLPTSVTTYTHTSTHQYRPRAADARSDSAVEYSFPWVIFHSRESGMEKRHSRESRECRECRE